MIQSLAGTKEEFYAKCLNTYGYVCPANEFDQPDFSELTFFDTCNSNWCPFFKSICRHFGGKKKTVSDRRRLAQELQFKFCIKEQT